MISGINAVGSYKAREEALKQKKADLADEKKRFMSLKTVTNKGNEMMNKQANMSKFSNIQQFMD